MSGQKAREALALISDVIANDRTVQAYRELIQQWEAQERRHEDRLRKLEAKERALQDRIEAQQVLHRDLRSEIDEMRMVLAEQLQVKSARDTGSLLGQNPDVAQYIRASRLLIQPGRKLTHETLRALGVTPPSGRLRPSEHYARSIATLVLPALGFEIIESRGAHPDLICRYEDRTIGVEVEVGLNDYDAHGHDAADAHVVVCWTPPTNAQVEDGFFRAKNVSKGYSPLLSVITLQTAQLHGSPFATGAKRFAYAAAS